MTPTCCAHGRSARQAASGALRLTSTALPGAIAILLPKCPLCIAAWVAAVTGIALPAVVLASLKPALAAACLLSIALLIRTFVRLKPSPHRSAVRSFYGLNLSQRNEIKVVLLSRPELGTYGGESVATPAIAGAFIDANRKILRRPPLRPEYAKTAWKA